MGPPPPQPMGNLWQSNHVGGGGGELLLPKGRRLSVQTEHSDDPEDVFGLHVAHQLRGMPTTTMREYAKLQIQQVLYNVRFTPLGNKDQHEQEQVYQPLQQQQLQHLAQSNHHAQQQNQQPSLLSGDQRISGENRRQLRFRPLQCQPSYNGDNNLLDASSNVKTL